MSEKVPPKKSPDVIENLKLDAQIPRGLEHVAELLDAEVVRASDWLNASRSRQVGFTVPADPAFKRLESDHERSIATIDNFRKGNYEAALEDLREMRRNVVLTIESLGKDDSKKAIFDKLVQKRMDISEAIRNLEQYMTRHNR